MIENSPFPKKMTASSGAGLVALAFLPAVVFGASADEPRAAYSIEAGAHVEYIENPQRLYDNDDEEIMGQARVRGTLRRDLEHFDIDIDYQGRRMDYKNDLLRDREIVTGSSRLVWIPREDFFNWSASNTRTFQLLDSLSPDNSDNRQVVNVSSTGPELILQLGGADRVVTQLDYTEADYGVNNFPEQMRYSGNVRYSHAFSSRFNVGLAASYMEAEFDDSLPLMVPGFQVETYTIPVNFTTERVGLSLEGGETRSKRDMVGENTNPFVRANVDLNFNPRSVLSLDYSEQYSDLLNNIRNRPIAEQDFIDDRLGNSNLFQIYQQTQHGARYTYTRPDSFTLSFNYGKFKREFDELEFSQDDERYSVSLTIPVGERLAFTLYGRHSDLEFPAQQRDQRRKEVALRGTYRTGRSLFFQFSVLHTDQTSPTLIDNYDGLNAFLSINFRYSG